MEPILKGSIILINRNMYFTSQFSEILIQNIY